MKTFLFLSIPILSIFLLKVIDFSSCEIQCDDHESTCDDQSTCCLMTSGEYGCCPMPNAVCCSDQIHCCPQDTTCDLQQLQCIKNVGDYRRLSPIIRSKTLAVVRRRNLEHPIEVKADSMLNNVVCPDGLSMCPNDTTCCPIDLPISNNLATVQEQQHFGCCPFPNATCCSDKEHCCPSDSKCDLAKGRCMTATNAFGTGRTLFGASDSSTSIPWSTKFEASENLGVITCGDHKSKCPEETTCFKLVSGQWGCCPMPQAICCSDGIHCCPRDTICDVEQQRCVQEKRTLKYQVDGFRGNSVAMEKIVHINSKYTVSCTPGGKFTCPADTTCCKLKSGKWGCCPMPQAVCCQDGEHCCPQNTKCDVAHSRCIENDLRRYFSALGQGGPSKNNRMKEISIKAAAKPDPPDVTKLCPDQKQECGIDQTCCLYNNATWTCCPFPQAVCCAQANPPYCCSHGQKCGASGQQSCVSESIVTLL